MPKKVSSKNLKALKENFPPMGPKVFLKTLFASDDLKREFFTPNLQEDIGLWVMESRVSRGMTVQELAKLAGLRVKVVQDLEDGNVMPECEIMGPLAHVFAITMDRKNWRTIVTQYGDYKIAKT